MVCSGASLLQHARQNLLSGLDQSLRPARLLRFECSHLDRKLGGTFHVLQIDELPSFELGAIGEIGVLGERVVLPAAGFVDGGAPPHAGGAVEVEEQPGACAAGVLEHEVAIEQNGFDFGQKGIVAVDVGPAGLHHADLGIGEVMNSAQQEIFRGSEVGVEDGDELTLRRLQSFGQRARLVAFAIRAVMVADGIAQRGVALDQAAGDFDGLVGRIVEHLDVELLSRILQLADRLQQALDYVLLVENRQLHRDARQVFKTRGRLGRAVLPVLVIQIDQDVAVHSVSREQNQHDEIRDQQRHIESVGVVESAKRGIEKVLADVGTDALGGSPDRQLAVRMRSEVNKASCEASILAV